MIEKNKKYTYEEIKKIFEEAQMKTLKKMEELMQEAKIKRKDDKVDALFDLTYSLQNIMTTAELQKNMFEEN